MMGNTYEELEISIFKEIDHIKNNIKSRNDEINNLNDRVYRQDARLTVVENNVSNNSKQLDKIEESVNKISSQLTSIDKSLNEKKAYWRAFYIIISIGVGIGLHEKIFHYLGLQ